MTAAKSKPAADPFNLTAEDVAKFSESWLDEPSLRRAQFRRVDRREGCEMVGQKESRMDCAGIAMPIIWPGAKGPSAYVVRRDSPGFEIKNGKKKEEAKYISAPGEASALWFMPGTQPEQLREAALPLVFTEGIKKGIALDKLSRHGQSEASETPRFLPCAILGVNNWRGVIGKELTEEGKRVPTRGPVTDLDRIVWEGRTVYICFDSDVQTNYKVRNAETALAEEMAEQRGAKVFLVRIPARTEDKAGVDDFLADYGPEETLELFRQALPYKKPSEEAAAKSLKALLKQVELFRSPDGKQYVTYKPSGPTETVLINSKKFRTYINAQHFKSTNQPLSKGKLDELILFCEAHAEQNGALHPVAVRLAEHNGRIYVDIADEERNAIEITGDGWRIIKDPPVKFRRTRSMLPLPVPVKGGNLTELRPFMNAATDDVWIPIIAWLLGTFNPKGPYPVLLLQGEQGTAKSTQTHILRSLIDPNTTDKRSFPKDERDLVIGAMNNWVLSYDNLSGLQPWQSDALCRVATEGTFATRALYENEEEIVFTICRPMILNGIDDIAQQGDLASRSISVTLQPIDKTARRPEREFLAEFATAAPRIMGALLTAVSAALLNRDQVELPELHRMADFELWVAGAAQAKALPFSLDSFLQANQRQASAAASVLFEGSTIGRALLEFARDRPHWTGTHTDLLTILNHRNPDARATVRAWPKNASAIGKLLRRDAPTLRQNGVGLEWNFEGHAKTRHVTVSYLGEPDDEDE